MLPKRNPLNKDTNRLSGKEKICQKDAEWLKNTTDQHDLINMQRTNSRNVHVTFTKRNYTLGHEPSPNNLKRIQVIESMFSWKRHVYSMFITALFIIARTWKQPRCPSADKWIRKLWYIYTMEYCSAIKKNTFGSVLMRWMKLEPIIQSEVSQKDKHQYSIIMHIYGI